MPAKNPQISICFSSPPGHFLLRWCHAANASLELKIFQPLLSEYWDYYISFYNTDMGRTFAHPQVLATCAIYSTMANYPLNPAYTLNSGPQRGKVPLNNIGRDHLQTKTQLVPPKVVF